MNRRTLIRTAVAAVIGSLAISSFAPPAEAHSGNQSYLYLDVTERSLGGRLELPLPDLGTTLGVDLLGADTEVLAGLASNEAAISAYLQEHMIIGTGETTWPIEFDRATLFYSNAAEQNDNYAVVEFGVDTAGAEVPRQLDITFDPFFDEIEGRDALLLIGNDWEGGVIENGHEVLVAFTPANRTQQIDLGETSWFKTFRSSVKLGVNHIRTGPDHIFFVLVLLLPSVLVFATRWRPAANFGSALWRVTKVVTMFTVAHTITFSLAGLDVLPLPPSRIVESIIALSIAAAALHNLKPVALNREWIIAFVFGLFHGMGFASLVEGLDVARSTQLVSLLGRNVGIEIGQTAVVLLVFPALFLLRRTIYYRPFLVIASVLLAFVSLGWLIERLFSVDLAVGQTVEPFVQWPRSVVVVAALTVIAAAIRRVEQRRGRLLPVAGEHVVEEAEPELDPVR
jgi:HupE / UreJ protein